jgi:polyisoprenyl-phosphate glycosyltransferase
VNKTATTEIDQSLIIPVFKNELNIPSLLVALDELSQQVGDGFEVVFVVDGSPDRSYALLEDALPEQPYASQLVALSRNFGSFAAVRCGLTYARGQYFAVMAADLQEPPNLVYEFFECLKKDAADVVFGQRMGRSDGGGSIFSNFYWGIYRRFVMPGIPAGGVDIFGCNELVRESLLQMRELNTSLIGQLFWVGYRRCFIPYHRRARKEGKSAWKLSRKLRYLLDSFFSFSDLPIILLFTVGAVGLALSIVLGISVLLAWLLGGITTPGYTPIVLILLSLGSIIIMGQGILGGYLWRTLQNTTNRPIVLVAKRNLYGVPVLEQSVSE